MTTKQEMTMSKDKSSKVRKRSFGTTMGITSIIAILVILVLVVFSTLSLITAKADLNLSEKTASNIEAYYAADAKGEIIISEISEIINSGSDVAGYAKDKGYTYEPSGGGGLLTFTVVVDDSRQLNAKVAFDGSGNVVEKQLWQVKPSKEWEADNPIQLFQ